MGINKKRIAQRQKAAAEAAKKEKNKKTNKIVGITLAVVAVLAIVLTGILLLTGNKKEDDGKFDVNKTYYADIVIKDYGTITVQLDGKAAPITVENFVKLAKSGFYDGLTFHRIMEGFMMQGGDPKGNGTGDPGYEIKGEFSENGWNNPLKHERGTISMARGNDPDSAGCQFFIVHETSLSNSLSLDGKYAAFGKVIEGIEVVDKVCTEAEPTDGNGSIAKDAQPVIEKITIREK